MVRHTLSRQKQRQNDQMLFNTRSSREDASSNSCFSSEIEQRNKTKTEVKKQCLMGNLEAVRNALKGTSERIGGNTRYRNCRSAVIKTGEIIETNDGGEKAIWAEERTKDREKKDLG